MPSGQKQTGMSLSSQVALASNHSSGWKQGQLQAFEESIEHAQHTLLPAGCEDTAQGLIMAVSACLGQAHPSAICHQLAEPMKGLSLLLNMLTWLILPPFALGLCNTRPKFELLMRNKCQPSMAAILVSCLGSGSNHAHAPGCHNAMRSAHSACRCISGPIAAGGPG